MENRAACSTSKSGSSECRGKQDVGLKYPRVPRYKESSSPHSEMRHKPNPQKNREVFDKRPRTRTGTVPEKYRSQVDESSNVGNLSKQGSKKISLNHLLNFTLTPIESRVFSGRRVAFNKSKLPKYNKELFLQANFQFVTRDDGDYSVYFENPDILVEWSLIEEVRLPGYEVPSCPICLFKPVAAKITRCGHIYCWPCILHYLALTDKSWQKCPICFEAVHKADLKSVLPTTQKPVIVGDQITMCLMKRERGSLFPVPATQPSLMTTCKVCDDNKITCFQKLLLANKMQICGIINREREELKSLLECEKDAPEICFIESALKQLDEREVLLNNNTHTEVERSELIKGENLYVADKNENFNWSCTSIHDGNTGNYCNLPASNYNYSGSSMGKDNITNVKTEDFILEKTDVFMQDTKKTNESEQDSMKDKAYYFYQAEDGQHIYMHNINVRMLVKEYGSLEHSPNIIQAKIVELEKTSMTEALRKRLRYLQHIPLTCEFQIAELNIGPYLSKITNEEFSGEILQRKNQRNRKAREEKQREKNIEDEKNRKLGKYPSPTYNLNSIDQFPAYGTANESPPLHVQSPVIFNESYEIQYPTTSVSTSPISCESDHISSATSFAQMLRDGPSSFSKHRMPCNNKTVKDQCNTLKQQQESDDECASVPEYRQSFSDALQTALDAVVSNRNLSAQAQQHSKKKKGKKTLLFTTSMHRSK